MMTRNSPMMSAVLQLERRRYVLLLKYARISVNTELQTFSRLLCFFFSELYKKCEAARHALRRKTLPES